MPLPKYYCDYCEVQFQDTPQARRRHLQGGQHQRARALYYNSLKGPNQIQTGVCNHFVRTGFCQYGDSCKYIHPNQNFQTPNSQVIRPGMNLVEMGQLPATPGSPPIREDSVRDDIIGNRIGLSLGNLPPSLRPPPEGGYPHLPFIDWG